MCFIRWQMKLKSARYYIAEVQLYVSSQSSNVSALSQHQKAESILIQFLLVCLLGNFNKKKIKKSRHVQSLKFLRIVCEYSSHLFFIASMRSLKTLSLSACILSCLLLSSTYLFSCFSA